MVDKFDIIQDEPYNAKEQKGLGAGGPEEEEILVQEVGTTVNLSDPNSQEGVEIIEDGSAIIGEQETQPI